MKLTREQVEAMLADGRQMDSAILARELLAAWDREAKLRAVADAAIPFVSPVQNADYGRQLRQHEALSSALAALGDTP